MSVRKWRITQLAGIAAALISIGYYGLTRPAPQPGPATRQPNLGAVAASIPTDAQGRLEAAALAGVYRRIADKADGGAYSSFTQMIDETRSSTQLPPARLAAWKSFGAAVSQQLRLLQEQGRLNDLRQCSRLWRAVADTLQAHAQPAN